MPGKKISERGEMKIYLNGKIVQAKQALLMSLMPGKMEGVGVFETMRIYQKEPESTPT